METGVTLFLEEKFQRGAQRAPQSNEQLIHSNVVSSVFFFFTVLEEYGSSSSSRHSWKFLKNQSSKKIIRTMVIKNQYLK